VLARTVTVRLVVIVLIVLATAVRQRTAYADGPPVTCVEDFGCSAYVEQPATPPRSTPGRARGETGQPSVTAPAARRCNNLAACPTGPAATPGELAQRAVRLLPIRGPIIGLAPHPGGTGLVGLPVWLWAGRTPAAWGPAQATAAVPGLAVTARARAVRVTWAMGDGGQAVVCDGPGTPYDPLSGEYASPDCGYTYSAASRTEPGGVFRVTATASWSVTWWVVGGGATGALTTTATSVTTVEIGEMQVVTDAGPR
jgi:hypothetical protein